MVKQYIYLIPIFIGFWFPLTFGVTTLISYYVTNIQTGAPFISDTGAWAPGSCVFTFFLIIGAITTGLFMYIRYVQMKEILKNPNSSKLKLTLINKISLCAGLIAIFGMLIVASFQETNSIVIHLLGAGITFGAGNLYMTIETCIALQVFPDFGKKWINFIRILLTTFCSLFNTFILIFGILAITNYTGTADNMPNWKSEDGGYGYKVWAAIFEWLDSICISLFFLLYAFECRNLNLSEPVITVKV